LYKIVRLIARLFFGFFTKLRVEGHDQLPFSEAFILTPNHFSNLDVFILSAAVKKEFYTLSKNELFKNPFLRFLLTRLNGIPVNRKGFCRETLKAALDILQQKKVVTVFPEGYVSKNGTLARFKQGVARLALEAKVPIIPVAIIGSNRVLPLGKKIPVPHRVTVKFGKPIYFNRNEEGYDRKIINQVTERVRREILALLNSEGTN